MSSEFHEITPEMAMWLGIARNHSANSAEKSKITEGSVIGGYLALKDEIWTMYGVYYQVFHPLTILSVAQVKGILYHVIKAFYYQTAISNSQDIEFLLYLAQERQISRAIAKIGIKEPKSGENEVEMGEILFGNPQAVKAAQRHLEANRTNLAHAPYRGIDPAQWEQYCKLFGVRVADLAHYLAMQGEQLGGLPPDCSWDQLQQAVSGDTLLRAIEQRYNMHNVRLFLDNFKDRT